MSTLRVEYPGLQRTEGTATKHRRPKRPGSGRLRRLPLRLLRWAVLAVVLAIVPFFLLIRGGVFAYQQWGLGPWPSLAVSAAATALLLVLYAWALGRRLGAGKGLKWLMTRGAAALAVAYVAYSVVYVGSAKVKSEEVRAEYAALHPLLRLAASAVILADQARSSRMQAASPTSIAGWDSHRTSRHCTSDRMTALCTRWTCVRSAVPSGGTAPSS